MLRHGNAARLVLIALLSMVMTACSDEEKQVGADIETLAIETSISTPSATQIVSTATDEPPLSTVDGGSPSLVIGTPQNSGQVAPKDVPTGPAPTEIPISRESTFDSDGDGKYTYDELKQAIAELMPSYEFPPNYQVTLDILMTTMKPFADKNASWQVPMEYTVLGTYHQCAWQLTWLDAYHDGDTALMDKSLDQLQTVALNDPTLDISLRDHMVEMYERAELGDPTLMQQYVDTSCQMEWATPDSGTPNSSLND